MRIVLNLRESHSANMHGSSLVVFLCSGNKIVISDIVLAELENNYSAEAVNSILLPFAKITEKIISCEIQFLEGRKISNERNIPLGDAMHAIIARDNKLSVITRDNHFKHLKDICVSHKPEDII